MFFKRFFINLNRLASLVSAAKNQIEILSTDCEVKGLSQWFDLASEVIMQNNIVQ